MLTSRQRPEELNSLVAITEILTGRLPFLEKCDSVLTVLAELTGSELVTLREWDSENATLDLVASHDSLTPSKNIRSTISESESSESQRISLPEKAVHNGTPVVVNDYQASETPNRAYLESGVQSALVFPVRID